MSTTTSSVNGEGATTSADDKKKSLEEKTEIAQRFDKEMKDYAKATVKEFLGIYGYEEDVDINIEDTGETPKSETTSNTTNQTVTATSVSGQPSSQSQDENISFIATTMSSSSSVEKGTTQHVTSLSISSSTNHGNADMTRFCITMSIPRNGADSEQGFTTLRFWNCIMCSTAFVGCKPEIVQRVHHPHLFTYQPEWLSHAGICTRCQNALTMRSPKITIYAINEAPQCHHSYTCPPASVPTVSQMCHGLPGQCNCAGGIHGHLPGVVPMVYTGTMPPNPTHGSNAPVVNIKTEAIPACSEAGFPSQYTRKPNYVFRPITCTQ